MGDSALTIDFLKDEFGVDPDSHLNARERAKGTAIQRLVENNLYWAMVYDRWVREENWPILKSTVLGSIPSPLRMVLAPIARRGVKKQLGIQGIGEHSTAEINAIAAKDIRALGALLGEQAWFLGDMISITAVSYTHLTLPTILLV